MHTSRCGRQNGAQAHVQAYSRTSMLLSCSSDPAVATTCPRGTRRRNHSNTLRRSFVKVCKRTALCCETNICETHETKENVSRSQRQQAQQQQMRCKYRRSKTLLCREIMQRPCEGTRHKRTVAAMDAGPSTGSGPRYMPLPVQGVTPFACAVEEQTKASFSVQTAAPAAQLRHGGCERAPTLPLHWVGCTGW